MVSRRFAVLAVVSAAVMLGGCGSGESKPPTSAASSTPSTPTAPSTTPHPTVTIPAPSPTGVAADPAAVQVIRGWANALRSGDVRSASRYFALPSEMINGVDANGRVFLVRIHSAAEALAANATLPCGAKFISADKRGRFVNALFRLTGRPGPGGSSCNPGAGATARTNFVIARGRIVEWVRAPDDPGDNGTSRPPPTPNGPPTTTGPNITA
jgi:hypothetical protein